MRMEGIQGMLNQETAGWIVGMCALVLLIGLGGRYMRRLAAVALRGGGGNGRHLLSGSAVYGFGDRASCRDQFVQYAGGRSPWFAGDWAFVRGSGDQNIVKNR